MEYFIINHGLGGGFGGANNYEVIKAANQEDAEKWAYENACEDYDSYLGMYCLRDINQIMEEDECGEEEAVEIMCEEREKWIEYNAVPFSKEAEEKVEIHHYHNPYREETDKLSA